MGKLTIRAIENAKPKEKAYKLIDGDGLQLRVATDGKKTWLVRYMVDGMERQYRLPRIYRSASGPAFYSLHDARDESSRIRALARQGIDYQLRLDEELVAEEHRRQVETQRLAALSEAEKVQNLSVQDLFESWTRDGVRRKDGNSELKRSFKVDVLPKIGDRPIRLVTEHDLRDLLRAIVARGVNRAAVITRNNLTQMFAWAEKRQPWRKLLADGNPMDLIEIGKIVSQDYDLRNQRNRILSDTEILELHHVFQRMQAAYDAASDKRFSPQPVEKTVQRAIWIMLSTLCRVGELSMARWENIDFDQRSWYIPRGDVKGNVGDHMVYLSDFALDQFQLLQRLTGKTEWCFPARNNDGHVCVKSMSKQVGDRQVLCKKTRDGQERKPLQNRRNDNTLVLGEGKAGAWTPHDLRRTGATIMQKLGVPLEIIDRCQNHVLGGSKVRRHYLHHDYAIEKRAAWGILGEHLSAILPTLSRSAKVF